jgi:hypothetical protein
VLVRKTKTKRRTLRSRRSRRRGKRMKMARIYLKVRRHFILVRLRLKNTTFQRVQHPGIVTLTKLIRIFMRRLFVRFKHIAK